MLAAVYYQYFLCMKISLFL